MFFGNSVAETARYFAVAGKTSPQKWEDSMPLQLRAVAVCKKKMGKIKMGEIWWTLEEENLLAGYAWHGGVVEVGLKELNSLSQIMVHGRTLAVGRGSSRKYAQRWLLFVVDIVIIGIVVVSVPTGCVHVTSMCIARLIAAFIKNTYKHMLIAGNLIKTSNLPKLVQAAVWDLSSWTAHM